MKTQYNVLFLCTGNSARSILAEALLNYLGRGKFRAFSAGSSPKRVVNPLALGLLREEGLPTEGLRPKSYKLFTNPGAPAIDIVITLCDHAAREACPIGSGAPIRVHWGIPDPAAVYGDDESQKQAFQEAYRRLYIRISKLVALPIEKLQKASLEEELRRIAEASQQEESS
jgi:arsenate reductase